jgi:hypothetical protein
MDASVQRVDLQIGDPKRSDAGIRRVGLQRHAASIDRTGRTRMTISSFELPVRGHWLRERRADS